MVWKIKGNDLTDKEFEKYWQDVKTPRQSDVEEYQRLIDLLANSDDEKSWSGEELWDLIQCYSKGSLFRLLWKATTENILDSFMTLDVEGHKISQEYLDVDEIPNEFDIDGEVIPMNIKYLQIRYRKHK